MMIVVRGSCVELKIKTLLTTTTTTTTPMKSWSSGKGFQKVKKKISSWSFGNEPSMHASLVPTLFGSDWAEDKKVCDLEWNTARGQSQKTFFILVVHRQILVTRLLFSLSISFVVMYFLSQTRISIWLYSNGCQCRKLEGTPFQFSPSI